MPVKELGDPRLQALFGTTDPRDAGVRPTVRLPRNGLPPVAIAAILLIAAVLLFAVLNARRTQSAQPSVESRPSDNGASAWAAPPPLYIPPVEQPVYAPPEQERTAAPLPPLAAPVATPSVRSAPASPASLGQVAPQVITTPTPVPPPQQHVSTGSPLVIDSGAGSPSGAAPAVRGNEISETSAHAVSRMRASAFANRSMTVPQGYLIPAVLETGFDSTKPGFARAMVSRDVHGFDGKYVLIPRGSRLIGDYRSLVAQGQKRAIITWTRLIRPDGMTIMMDAPAVDPLGGGGIPASVNNHFFAKLGDALLQSTFAIGHALAGRAVTGPVVVLSGNVASTAPQSLIPATNYVPTLKVAPGKSISVFVAQDLDFTSAGAVH